MFLYLRRTQVLRINSNLVYVAGEKSSFRQLQVLTRTIQRKTLPEFSAVFVNRGSSHQRTVMIIPSTVSRRTVIKVIYPNCINAQSVVDRRAKLLSACHPCSFSSVSQSHKHYAG